MNEIKQGKKKFYIGTDEENTVAEIGVLTKEENVIEIDHTYVSDSLKGQGVGAKLVDKVVCYAADNEYKIIATCPYAKKVIEKTDNYKYLLKK